MDYKALSFNYSFIYAGERYSQRENIAYNIKNNYIMIVKDIRNKYILCCCMLMFFCSTICSKSFRYNGLKYNIISEDKLECEVTFNGKEYFDEPYTADSVKVGE